MATALPHMQYSSTDPNGFMYEIYPNLYIGGFNASLNYNYLKQYGITHIINCAEEQFIKHPGIKVYNFQLDDSPLFPIHEYFTSISNLIRYIHESNPNNKVLVSCAMGINRSMTILIAYLISRNKALNSIIKYIISVRPYAMLTNMAFYTQLCLYDQQCSQKKNKNI